MINPKEITTLLQILRRMNLAKWRLKINTVIEYCQESTQINNCVTGSTKTNRHTAMAQ